MALQHQMISPLLLKNGGQEANMCCLNSVLQLLRHVPEFLSELETLRETSALMNTLHSILSQCGSLQPSSALLLRDILAVTNTDISSRGQNDSAQLLGFILNHCPSDIFDFDTSVEHRFWINNSCNPCPSCKKYPSIVPGTDKVLKLSLDLNKSDTPNPANPSLNHLLKKHFKPQYQSEGRRCSHCSAARNYPYKEKLNIQVSTVPVYPIGKVEVAGRRIHQKSIAC